MLINANVYNVVIVNWQCLNKIMAIWQIILTKKPLPFTGAALSQLMPIGKNIIQLRCWQYC